MGGMGKGVGLTVVAIQVVEGQGGVMVAGPWGRGQARAGSKNAEGWEVRQVSRAYA